MDASKTLPIERQDGKCETHGAFIDTRINIRGKDIPWSGCPQCAEIQIRRQSAEDQLMRSPELRMKALERRLGRTRIPPRFCTRTFDNFIADTKDKQTALRVAKNYAKAFDNNLAAGRCIAFLGKPGTGKTHLAVAIARSITEQGYTALYIKTLDYIRQVRDSWAPDSTMRELAVIQQFVEPDFLILDEVGMQYGTDGELVQITDLLDKRYLDLKPTLVMSNENIDGLKTYLGDRAFDRLRENGGEHLIFDWESHRGTYSSKMAAAGYQDN